MSQRIVWFCLDSAERAGNKPVITCIEHDVLSLYVCKIPRYYAAKKSFLKRTVRYITWNKAALLQTMQNCCLTLCADKYYLDAEWEAMEAAEPAFWNVKQRMEEELLTDRLRNIGWVNRILWISGKENICRHIPMELLSKVQIFYVLHAEEDCEDKRKAIGDTEKFLWEEYGMPLIHIRSLREISCKKEERLLVLYDDDKQLPLSLMPCKVLCFDLWSDEKLRGRIQKERPDAKYVSEYCYLQKLVQDTPCC